jgi:hypothetical protein
VAERITGELRREKGDKLMTPGRTKRIGGLALAVAGITALAA